MSMPGFTADLSCDKASKPHALALRRRALTLRAVVPQFDVCYPVQEPCITYPDGSVGYCTVLKCTESGVHSLGGPPPWRPLRML
jgi:hypothetical protein